MKFNKKILLGLTLTLLLSAGVVYAASSSDYLTKAQQYINANCDKANLSEKTSLDCYLFKKINESQSGNKDLMMLDANNVDMGIFIDYDTFLYAPLNKLLNVDLETGFLTASSVYNSPGAFGSIYYTELNCEGTAYLTTGNVPQSLRENTIYPEGNGKYYVVDKNIPLTPSELTLVSSYQGNSCVSLDTNHFKVYTLQEVTVTLPNPVSLPLQFKYQ